MQPLKLLHQTCIGDLELSIYIAIDEDGLSAPAFTVQRISPDGSPSQYLRVDDLKAHARIHQTVTAWIANGLRGPRSMTRPTPIGP